MIRNACDSIKLKDISIFHIIFTIFDHIFGDFREKPTKQKIIIRQIRTINAQCRV